MCGKGGLPLVSTLAAHGAPAMTHQQGCGGAAPPYPRGGSGWDQDPKTRSMDNFRAASGERTRFRTFRTRPEAIGDKGIEARIMTGRGPHHPGELGSGSNATRRPSGEVGMPGYLRRWRPAGEPLPMKLPRPVCAISRTIACRPERSLSDAPPGTWRSSCGLGLLGRLKPFDGVAADARVERRGQAGLNRQDGQPTDRLKVTHVARDQG